MSNKKEKTEENEKVKNADFSMASLVEEGGAIDAQAIMAEFDRESNTRHFSGIPKTIIRYMLASFTLFVIYASLFPTWSEYVRRGCFVALIVFMAFMVYPAKHKNNVKVNYIPWYDIALGVIGAGCYFYIVVNTTDILVRSSRILPYEVAIGVVGILILAEICRRCVGLPILVVVTAFIIYAFAAGYSHTRIIYHLFYTLEGVMGTPMGVCSTFIVLFVILAAFLEKTNIGSFFIDISNSIAGWASGGPAKVAVITSAFEGMYSGSSVANTVGSGSITIPVMKKTGYKPEFAAAVEAAASTGGQIMPPIMGAAAFLMAEMTDTPYAVIAVSAILPALLYFLGIFMMIHFEAKKLGLKGLPKESIPHFGKLLLKKGYLFLPVIILVALMSVGYTPSYSACFAILAAVIASSFSKDTRMTPKAFGEALANGAQNTIGVAVSCAVAGIIVGTVTLTGLGQQLIGALLSVAQTSQFLALFLAMIACIILGMGVPTTANYVIMATITAPIVIQMGVPMLAAHMFVFYFGIVADITPPVALAAYAGAAIANSDPIKTGITATRLAITAFIVPYIFVYSPEMLFIDTDFITVIRIIITSIIGIVGVASALEGYLSCKMSWPERIAALCAGLMLIDPSFITDVIGVILVASIVLLQKHKAKKLAIA